MADYREPTFSGRRSARRLHQDIHDASSKHSAALEDHLKQHARRQGWPDDAVQHLYVEYSEGGYHPRYHPEGAAQVAEQEYGSLLQRANPALRTWALHSHEHASSLHDAALYSAIADELF